MEENERYELNDNDCIIDNEKDVAICDICDVSESPKILVNLLNQQDKRIKELELLLKADKKIKTNSLNGFEKLRQENQQLKQSQKKLAISELVKIKRYIDDNAYYIDELNFGEEINEYIDNQINELKEKNNATRKN